LEWSAETAAAARDAICLISLHARNPGHGYDFSDTRRESLRVKGVNNKLYSFSYLGYICNEENGMDEALFRVVVNLGRMDGWMGQENDNQYSSCERCISIPDRLGGYWDI